MSSFRQEKMRYFGWVILGSSMNSRLIEKTLKDHNRIFTIRYETTR